MKCLECSKNIKIQEQHAVTHTTTGLLWYQHYYHLSCFIAKVKKGEIKVD